MDDKSNHVGQELKTLQFIVVGFRHFELYIKPEKNMNQQVFHDRPMPTAYISE